MPALQRALDRMHNRGPDAEGVWQEPGVWLGHRRLAILDLDARANQPMRSACGRYVIVFNGEIYNFRELRDELAAKGFAVPHQFGYRSVAGPVRAGRGGDVAAPARHVRPGHLGQRGAARLCRARPLRHQAAVLGADGRWRAAGFAGQGLAGHRQGLARAVRAGAGGVLAARQRGRAAHLVSRYSRPAGRALRLDRGWADGDARVLVGHRRRLARRTRRRAAGAAGARTGARRAARERGGAPGGGCAGRRVPVGRHRFGGAGRADGGGRRARPAGHHHRL